MATINIVTHNSTFHADDVMASALIKVFVNSDIAIYRVGHQTNVETFIKDNNLADVWVCDIGRIYDSANLRFDHHQYSAAENPHAAAGLVFNYLVEKGHISPTAVKMLESTIQMVDENDIGIWEGVYEGTLPWIVSSMNSEDIYSEEQDEAFLKAVDFVSGILESVKNRADKIDETKKILDSSKEILPGVLEMPGYLPGWNDIIFDIEKLNHIDLVIWYDETQDKWKVQQVPDSKGSFGRRGRQVPFRDPLPDGCEFLHRGNFFGVFNSKESLIDYIKTI